MGSRNIVTLITDFGTDNWFAGTMKGVIKRINPDAGIVDISHSVRRFNTHEAAFTLLNSYSYFPKETVHVVVVDPGVGSERRGIAARSRDHFFVGPDNGVFSYVMEREEDFRVVSLENPEYMLEELSNTFHGRDVFAPAAAYLTRGVKLEEFGPQVKQPVRLRPSVPGRLGARELVGHIMYVDHFGNCISDIRGEDILAVTGGEMPRRIKLSIRDNVIRSIASAYSEGKEEELICLIGSTGFLEFAVFKGNANKLFTIEEGGEFILKAL